MSKASIRTVCPRCDAELQKEAVYCSSCGREVEQPSKTSKYSNREKAALGLFSLIVLGSYFLIVQAVASRIKLHPTEISSTLIVTGLLTSGVARKRRVLFFLVGCLLALPLMFFAAILGGALRAP